jgi:hypothetical protein
MIVIIKLIATITKETIISDKLNDELAMLRERANKL